MRLIGSFNSEKEAHAFYSFLLHQGIHSIYEAYSDAKTEHKGYHLWIYNEEDFPIAVDFLNQYRQHPEDPKFQDLDVSLTSVPPPLIIRKLLRKKISNGRLFPQYVLKSGLFESL